MKNMENSGYELVYYHIFTGRGVIPTAAVKLKKGDLTFQNTSTGVDSIDAINNAIRKATSLDVTVNDLIYEYGAPTRIRLTLNVNGWEFVGYGEGRYSIETAVNAYMAALNKSQEEIGKRKIRTEVNFDGHGVLMFLYVKNAETAGKIAKNGILEPEVEETLVQYGSAYCMPHVTLINVKPEEGRKKIALALGTSESNVEYCLELIVDGRRVVEGFKYLPNSYQIFSEKPVPVKVVAIRDMDKIGKGFTIRRFTGKNGHPYGFYVLSK